MLACAFVLREAVKIIKRGGLPKFQGGYIPISAILGGDLININNFRWGFMSNEQMLGVTKGGTLEIVSDFRGGPNQYCIFQGGSKPILPFLGGVSILGSNDARLAQPPPLSVFMAPSHKRISSSTEQAKSWVLKISHMINMSNKC